ncbi:MAG: antibiotic biosynthesis monooxygenase [Anaerolineales bacterium]|nr:antibiotic biosynthesis monooxygenase [Chloroflexaceae bacterium]NJN93596.1 antibiotic biosynthesis monooxygenase [Anaerolineales bacterium]
MLDRHVRVVARIIAQPDAIDEVRSVLIDLIEPTRQESGCVAYEVLQADDRPAQFVVLEIWATRTDFQQHMESDHFNRAADRLAKVVAETPSILSYTDIS